MSPAQDRGAGGLRRPGRDHRLLLGLHRARPGDDRERAAADRRRAHLHRRGLGMQVARDHLVGLADLDHVVDAGSCLNGIAWKRAVSPTRPDDGVHGAAGDERLAPGVAHLLADEPRCPRPSRPASSRRPCAVDLPSSARAGPGKGKPRVSARGRCRLDGYRRLPRVAPEVGKPVAEEALHDAAMMPDATPQWQANAPSEPT